MVEADGDDDDQLVDDEPLQLQVTAPAGGRLDRYLADQLPEHSRSFWKRQIERGRVLLDGQPTKPRTPVEPGQLLDIVLPPPAPSHIEPEPIPLDILFEDDQLVVVNKVAGLVVHPAPGHATGTLVHGLAWHIEHLSERGGHMRPGIVHRLDMDTSGVMVVAKTNTAHAALSEQFKARQVKKQYRALTRGVPRHLAGKIDLPLGRSLRSRQKMAIREDRGKPAQTRYKVLESWGAIAWMALFPRTGRTHQLRVHLRSLTTPVLCDGTYGGGGPIYRSVLAGRPRPDADESPILARQALHAYELGLYHPTDKQWMTFQAPLPADMEAVLEELRKRE